MTKEDAKEIVALFGYKSSTVITIDDNYFIFRKGENLFLIVTDEDNAEIYDLTDSSHTDIVSAGNILLEMVNKASETTDIPLFTIAYDSSSGKAWIEETGNELGDFDIIKLPDDDLMKLCLDNEEKSKCVPILLHQHITVCLSVRVEVVKLRQLLQWLKC